MLQLTIIYYLVDCEHFSISSQELPAQTKSLMKDIALGIIVLLAFHSW